MILLREKREQRGLTQFQLSQLSGVPQQTISAIESKVRTNPGIETIRLLCLALQCPIDEIVVEDGANRNEDVA